MRSLYSDWPRTGQRVQSSSPGKGRDFSLLHVVQPGSEAHPASHLMGTGAYFPGIKQQEREADHSPTNAEVKNTLVYTSTPSYALLA
jgi:hypothetical protein